MHPYVIVTDSSSDLPRDVIEQYDLSVIQLAVTVEGEQTKPNNEIDITEFYAKLRAKKGAKTSAVNIETFEKEFEAQLAQGKDVLYLGFSSGLSGTFNAGFVAAREMSEKYPERTCVAIDTLCASLG